MPSIAAIISYCTSDYRFLRFCIEGARPFCSQIIIPVSTHLFSGEEENLEMLHRSYAEHPDCSFIEFAYDPDRLYGFGRGAVYGTETWLHYWHSTSRYVGWHFLQEEIDAALFLDVDEICDGLRFKEWLSKEEMAFKAQHFSSYLYFREPIFRATTHCNSALLLQKDTLPPELLLNYHERPGIFYQFKGKKRNSVRGLDNKPMVHHYSWARPKEEIVLKTRNWGHVHDKDWETLIEEEFSRPFAGKEQFCGFEYNTVEPTHLVLDQDISSLKDKRLFRDLPKSSFPNLKCVNAQDILRLGIEKLVF